MLVLEPAPLFHVKKGEKLTGCRWEPTLHGSLTFLHVLQTEALTDFVPDHHFKAICLADSLRR